MRVSAIDIVVGDAIPGIGTVSEVKHFLTDVADKTVRKTPNGPRKRLDRLGHARLIAREAETQYTQEVSSVYVRLGGIVKNYRPEDLVEIHERLSAAA